MFFCIIGRCPALSYDTKPSGRFTISYSFTGHFDTRKIKWEELNRKVSEAMQEVGLAFSPGRMMKGLSVAEQQLIEIASALSSDAKIIFMDETTASLTPSEVDNLLELIDILRKKGKTIVYISHRLEEIKAVSDRITGKQTGMLQKDEITDVKILFAALRWSTSCCFFHFC